MLTYTVLATSLVVIYKVEVSFIVGVYHTISVVFCSCETEVETLLHARLFPATPKFPQLAFTFELLDFMEALLWECQVSAHDFVAAVGHLSDGQVLPVHLMSMFFLVFYVAKYFITTIFMLGHSEFQLLFL